MSRLFSGSEIAAGPSYSIYFRPFVGDETITPFFNDRRAGPILWRNLPNCLNYDEYDSLILNSPSNHDLKFHIIITNYTSSTAQGGGGSFKNRKPIGEIGCCESPMAEQKH